MPEDPDQGGKARRAASLSLNKFTKWSKGNPACVHVPNSDGVPCLRKDFVSPGAIHHLVHPKLHPVDVMDGVKQSFHLPNFDASVHGGGDEHALVTQRSHLQDSSRVGNKRPENDASISWTTQVGFQLELQSAVPRTS